MCALAGQLGYVASTVSTLSLNYQYSPTRSLIEYVAPISVFVRGIDKLVHPGNWDYGASMLLREVVSPCSNIMDLARYAEGLYSYGMIGPY